MRGKADSLATQLTKELSAKGVPAEFPTSPADAEKRAAYCYDVTVRFYIKDAEKPEKPKRNRNYVNFNPVDEVKLDEA